MRKLFLTLFYSGLSPKAPGTVGSFVALILGMLLIKYIPHSTLFLLAFLISVIAAKQIDIYEKEVGEHDSKEIVIDELAGMWIALSICGINEQNFYILSILAFLSFRLFDIWKPSIIGKIDKDVDYIHITSNNTILAPKSAKTLILTFLLWPTCPLIF